MLDLRREYEYLKQEIDRRIHRCLEHQQWILGSEVKELEVTIAGYLGVRYCIGVASGTDALVLSLRALAIKLKGQEYFDRSDEIITTPFTFTATGDAILRAGATPVFVDIDPETYNIDTNTIKAYLNSFGRGRVVGIIPVHLYGQSCEMDGVMKIADEYRLFVLEDVAQAFGGSWEDKKLGSIGIAGAFSFFPSKNLGGFGDGGMVATNDQQVAEIVRMLLKHGGRDKYNVDYIGYNSRLDTLQAAVLLAKMKYLGEFNDRRKKIAAAYDKGLTGLKGLTIPHKAYSDHVYHQYTIRVARRDQLQSYLKEKGITSMVYYPFSLHKMNVFENGRSKVVDSLKHAEEACHSVLSLPIEPLQTEEETTYVIDSIKDYFLNRRLKLT
jgi:dTDP-4-amino-4,6-dideoxygalactose transaminase